MTSYNFNEFKATLEDKGPLLIQFDRTQIKLGGAIIG